jgi:hypothetical protein
VAEEGGRDEEPGDDEEHVDAAGDTAQEDVVQRDQERSDGSQALDLGSEASTVRFRRTCPWHNGRRAGHAGRSPLI